MDDLVIGLRAKFFHPGTLGVMLWGTVLEIYPDDTVLVKFDNPHNNDKNIFRVPGDHIA